MKNTIDPFKKLISTISMALVTSCATISSPVSLSSSNSEVNQFERFTIGKTYPLVNAEIPEDRQCKMTIYNIQTVWISARGFEPASSWDIDAFVCGKVTACTNLEKNSNFICIGLFNFEKGASSASQRFQQRMGHEIVPSP